MALRSLLAFWLVALLLIAVPGADWAFTIGAGLRGRSVLPAVGGLVAGYLAVTAVVAARGATLWAGPVLDRDPPACERVLDRVVEHPVRVGRAAGMFWRNAATWGSEVADAEELIAPLRALEADDPDDDVMWELRQTAWSRVPMRRG